MALKKLSTFRPKTTTPIRRVSSPITRAPLVPTNPYARLIGPASQTYQGPGDPDKQVTPDDTSKKTADEKTEKERMQTEQIKHDWDKYTKDYELNKTKIDSDAATALMEMENQLKELQNNYELGKTQLSNEDAASLRDYEAQIAQMKNDLELGKGSLQTQLELQKMNNTLGERLGMAGYKADLIKSKMNADVTRELESMATMSDFQLGKGELGLNQLLGQSATGAELAANLGSLGSQERMGSSANAANMAMQGRGIASNERLGMAGLGAQMAQGQMQLQAERESGLLGGALDASNQRAAGERGRQTGLTGQALAAYQALAQAQSGPPGGWLNSWFANRGQAAPEGADTGLAQNLGQFAAQLGATGLGVDPNSYTDRMIANIYNKGNRAEVGSMDDLIDASTAGAYEGLPQERASYDARTGRMMQNSEYNRGKDAAFQKDMARRLYECGTPGQKTIEESTDPGMPAGYRNFRNMEDYYGSETPGFEPGDMDYDMPDVGDPNYKPGKASRPAPEMTYEQSRRQPGTVSQFPTPGGNVRKRPGPPRRPPGRVINNAGMGPRGGPINQGFLMGRPDRGSMVATTGQGMDEMRRGRPDRGPGIQPRPFGRIQPTPFENPSASGTIGGMETTPNPDWAPKMDWQPGGMGQNPQIPTNQLGDINNWTAGAGQGQPPTPPAGYDRSSGLNPDGTPMATTGMGMDETGRGRLDRETGFTTGQEWTQEKPPQQRQQQLPPWMQQRRMPPQAQRRPMPQRRVPPQRTGRQMPRQRGAYQGI